MDGFIYEGSGGSSTPENTPCPSSGSFGPNQPPEEHGGVKSLPTSLPHQIAVCHPAPSEREGMKSLHSSTAPRRWPGHLLSEVKGRQYFPAVTCFTHWHLPSPPPKLSLFGKAASKSSTLFLLGYSGWWQHAQYSRNPRYARSQEAPGMKLAGHAWFPTNSQRTFLPSGPPTTSTVCFMTFLSFGEAPTLEAQGPGFFCVLNGSWQSPAHHTDGGNSLNWVHQELGVPERKSGAILILLPTCTLSSIFLLTQLCFPPLCIVSTNVTDDPSCRHAAVLTSSNKKSKDKTMPSLINEFKVLQSENTGELPM